MVSLPKVTRQPMYCHNIPREYNSAIGQKRQKPLPRKCPLWAAHLHMDGLSQGQTVVWEAALSAELHRPFISLLESRCVSMGSDSLQPCLSRHGVKSSFQFNLGAFQTFCWSKTFVLLLRVDPRLLPMDR